VSDPNKLRELAAWCRDFAERAGSPWVWEARLRTARTSRRKRVGPSRGTARKYRSLPKSPSKKNGFTLNELGVSGGAA
jgi:hypothetical protein